MRVGVVWQTIAVIGLGLRTQIGGSDSHAAAS